MKQERKFKADARKKAFDLKHRKTLKWNIGKYHGAVSKGKARYENLQLARWRAAYRKRKILEQLDLYLEEFERNATRNGIKVLWAQNAREAMDYVVDILKAHHAKLLVKSKSMTSEELEFNETVERETGCESVETDLGEFIVQLAGEKPYHIVTPAMHKSKEDVAALFHEKFGTPEDMTPTEMSRYVRGVLRKKFVSADIGVTGANFLIADTGSVCVTENEGNGVMTTSFPKVHIALAGIEKLVPSYKDLGILWPLLACMGTGQQISAYNTMFSGPRREGETSGPEEMYVILLDNGRTTLYDDPESFEALACMRCGACLNACPVYKTIGGYTYNATYSGPIGSVITPFYKGFEAYGHLSGASSLCGACAEVCPQRIPLPDLLLVGRRKGVEQGLRPVAEKVAMKTLAKGINRRWVYNLPAGLKNLGMSPLNYTLWGPWRDMPKFKKTFAKQVGRNEDGTISSGGKA